MTLKKSLSFLLALTLVLSLLAPCGALIPVSAATVLYGDGLEQVTEPTLGENYYLAANAAGTMHYFVLEGSVTDTVPYSLHTTTDIEKAMPVAPEAPVSGDKGFQITFTHPTKGLLRIYCFDAKNSDKIMDTGTNSGKELEKHTFFVDDLDGVKILRQISNENVLVLKYNETKSAWRMLGVTEDELGTEGVYPVMLLQEHTHSFGEVTVDGIAASRTCASCGFVETVYGQKMIAENEIVVGNDYYLVANIDGTMHYVRHGSVAETKPCSLPVETSVSHKWVLPMTFAKPVEGDEGFQIKYTNPSSNKLVGIYCFDSVDAEGKTGEDGVIDTGVNATPALDTHTFVAATVNGNTVLQNLGNGYVLVMKQMDQTRNDTVTTAWRMIGVPVEELENEGVYPVTVMQAHEHEAATTSYVISDSGHSPLCWCGGICDEVAHTLGEVTHNADNTHTRACTVCGYENVIYGEKYEQVNTPTVGETYALAANVNGQLLSFISGGVTETTPYSLKTSETLATVTVQTALVSGQGEFQLVDGSGRYIYSVSAGAGLTTSNGYITDPKKVSFSMDEVDVQTVIRAYGTNLILVAKYSDAKSAWRIFAVEESELANEGVYPVVLLGEHEHTYGAWSELSEDYTQTRTCTLCGHVETMWGAQDKAIVVEEPVIGESYYLVANVNGTLRSFVTGGVGETKPYSLKTDVISGNSVKQVILETAVTAGKGEFQLSFYNGTALNRIYCYDALKDSDTVTGQTGVMDTGTNGKSTPEYHTFLMDTVNGVTVLRKYSNNNVLVAKYNETKGAWRILGVPETELGTEGVYPVMLANVHTHSFGEEVYSNQVGHWHVCDCGSKSAVESHDFGNWTLDAENKTQSATCTDCGYDALQVQSPYFDTVDSKNELHLAEIAYDEAANVYSVTGGAEYYLMTEVDGVNYYFRQTTQTAGGNNETVTSTTANSLYSTSDPNHKTLGLVKVVAGNTEGTYILTATTDLTRVLYVNDEGNDDDIDVGITAFKGASDNATYIARAEAQWDAENGYFYHMEDKVKYVLVLKQLEATYTVKDADTGETVVVEGPQTEWRITAVPEAEAIPESGCYIMKLAQHVHNLDAKFTTDNEYHWKNCGCDYQDKAEHTVEDWTVVTPPTETATGSKTGVCTVCGATVTVETPITVNEWNITLSDNIGVNFVLALAKGDEVTVTVDGNEVPVTLNDNRNGTFNVAMELAAAQMTSEIAITVNGYAVEKTYSVRGYADTILAGDYTDEAKALVQYMLVYGSAAQNYFDCNEDNLAGNDINVELAEPETAAELEVYNEFEAVKFYGASLVHKTKTAVRFYFTAESIEGLTFLVDGNVYEPVSKDGMYYIEVAGINPQDLADTVSVVVTDGTSSLAVKYSPLIYIERMYHKSGAAQTTKDLVQTMYNYHLSAKDYIIKTYTGGIKESASSQLYKGVQLREMSYIAAGYGDIEAYALVVDADANVELKIAAGAWDENTSASNPADVSSVSSYFRSLQKDYNVVAMTNGGFFDLNTTKTMKPYGMQIVDGVVKQAPSKENSKYTDNWFGMTKDGKYVISDTDGYETTYKDNIQQGVGGGLLLMVDGVAQEINSDRDYRTAVGVNADGDMVLVAVEKATYSDVTGIFASLGLDIVTVLNLDGGGSTAMYVPGTFYPKAKILGDDGWLPREVADAIAIVEKQ